MAKKIPQEEADNEVVMVGVVINSTNILRPQPTTPPPGTPICVIKEVWGNHQDGMVGPPAASPGAPPHGKPTTSREEIKILVTKFYSNDECSNFSVFTIFYSYLYTNLQRKCK